MLIAKKLNNKNRTIIIMIYIYKEYYKNYINNHHY